MNIDLKKLDKNLDKFMHKKNVEFVNLYMRNKQEIAKNLDGIINTTISLAYSTKQIAIIQFLIFRLDLWFDYFKYKIKIKKAIKEKKEIEEELFILNSMNLKEKILYLKANKYPEIVV